ncbi:MAG: glycosyltransferase family 4 protein [Deltaproteobacteria bacterium]|nr:glycosyltransferase family 4 protein [Deltaproteobacteria bacterium]
MRVALIAPLLESVPPKLYGGTERVVHNLALGLSGRGADVTVFASGDSNTAGELATVWPEALRLRHGNLHNPTAYQIRMLETVARRSGEFDLIHNHYDYPLLPLARMVSCPVLTTLHNSLDAPDVGAAFEMYADLPYVSISDSQRAPMPHLGWTATIQHGIDVNAFEARPVAGDYLAFLGRFSAEKGAHVAIEIARRAGIPLKLAAKVDEAYPEYYEREIKPKLDGRNVEYLGEITEKEKSEFLGGALALVNPIDWAEPFGLVMVEAMACGTPVLTRPVGSAPEVVREGVTGFLRSDPLALAKLVREAAALDRMAIRREVERKFSIERMTQEYLDVYRRLVRGYASWKTAGRGPGWRRPPFRHKSTHPGGVADHRRDLLHSVDGALDGDLQGIS